MKLMLLEMTLYYLRKNVSNEIFNLTNDIKSLVELTRVELEAKLSNPLIDKTTKNLLKGR